MKVLIQVVKDAKVIDNESGNYNDINHGYLLFVGIEQDDNMDIIYNMAQKVMNMRINKDSNGKTNLSIFDINGEILSISQFTLCADTSSRRPSFTNAADKDKALELFNYFNQILKDANLNVKCGYFAHSMDVKLTNDGPFTIFLDSNVK